MNIDGQRQGMIRTKAIACVYDTVSASVEPDSSTSKSEPIRSLLGYLGAQRRRGDCLKQSLSQPSTTCHPDCSEKHPPLGSCNSLAENHLQCFMQRLFQLLGHSFSKMGQAVFYWAFRVSWAKHWWGVTVKACAGEGWRQDKRKIKINKCARAGEIASD